MAGLVRICLIADGFFDDFQLCLDSIRKNTDTPISTLSSGKENRQSVELFDATWQKNKLGWGHSINYFLSNCQEKYLVIMDPSTRFTADAISPTLKRLESGYEGVGWRGGLVDLDDDWRSVVDRGEGEVDVLFSYFFAFDREFVIKSGGANPSATYYRNADIELSLAVRAFGGRLWQLDLPLEQGRHHGYHDVDPQYRDKKSKENYNRILEKYRGRNDILSPRR
jgi:hypothetical protein